MDKGLDANVDLTDYAGHLAADGFVWVGRYINPGKDNPLDREEAEALTRAGLWMVSLWEEGEPTHAGYFTEACGLAAGAAAAVAAKRCGMPGGLPIYFAVDYDAEPGDLGAISAYFRGVRGALASYHAEGNSDFATSASPVASCFATSASPVASCARYHAGVYGSGRVCGYLFERGLVSKTWLAQSRGWAGYEDWSPHAEIVQGAVATWRGLDVDTDESHGTWGGWQLAGLI